MWAAGSWRSRCQPEGEHVDAFSISPSVASLAPGETSMHFVQFSPSQAAVEGSSIRVRNLDNGEDILIPVQGMVQVDADGDGVGSIESGGHDCDDTDPWVLPGAEDTWYDGVDSDCAGNDDFDADADGHAAEDWGGTDCDDLDASIHPGAPETWYDGIDSDCRDDDDFDADGDGFDTTLDCDDTDPSVYPGASETWYDGIDGDCQDDDDFDADGDGFDTTEDCDDSDGSIWPGAEETWYDGVDDDCDGGDDDDADGDGLGIDDDCDDSDPLVGGPTDETFDGTDEDCDGETDAMSIAAAMSGVVYGTQSDMWLGGARQPGGVHRRHRRRRGRPGAGRRRGLDQRIRMGGRRRHGRGLRRSHRRRCGGGHRRRLGSLRAGLAGLTAGRRKTATGPTTGRRWRLDQRVLVLRRSYMFRGGEDLVDEPGGRLGPCCPVHRRQQCRRDATWSVWATWTATVSPTWRLAPPTTAPRRATRAAAPRPATSRSSGAAGCRGRTPTMTQTTRSTERAAATSWAPR